MSLVQVLVLRVHSTIDKTFSFFIPESVVEQKQSVIWFSHRKLTVIAETKFSECRASGTYDIEQMLSLCRHNDSNVGGGFVLIDEGNIQVNCL